MNIPAELKYTKDHEWVKIEGDTAIVGITDFAQSELGDIVFVDVESVDEELNVGDVYLPISGKVIEFNEELESEPELVNTDPYGKGWIIKLKIANDADQSELLSAEQYQEVIG